MKTYFILSRNGFVATICVVLLTFLMLGVLKTALIPKPKDGDTNENRVNYLSALGYKVEETPIMTKETVIPFDFGDEFKEYLNFQKDSGFPLGDYLGEAVTVYKYKGENEMVTLIVFQGDVIGGHVENENGEGPLEKG